MMFVLLALALASSQQVCRPLSDPQPAPEDRRPAAAAGDGLWIGGIAFTPADIAAIAVRQDNNRRRWVLDLRFTPAGNAKFLRAQHCSVGHPIEISVDRTVLSRPRLNEPIVGGTAVIASNWSDRAAVDEIAARIRGS